jgi:hypothetical protein
VFVLSTIQRQTTRSTAGVIELNRQLGDRADLDFNVLLTMPSATLAVFTSSELLNEDLIAFGFADDLGGYFGTVNGRRAQFEVAFAFGDGQNLVKSQFRSRFKGAVVNLKELALFDFVLVTAVRDNRVHTWFTGF